MEIQRTMRVLPSERSDNQKEKTSGSGDSSIEAVKNSSSEEVEKPWELDADGLRIFGEDPVLEEPELILHSSVATRWKKYLSDGLTKEVKESLLKKYPRKGKLSFEPPILNDEVAVNLKESALKRDKYFGATQKLAGSALSALAPVIESLAPLKDPDHVKNLEQVWNAAKLLIEIHRSQTVARKACILPTLSKTWATTLEKRVTDSYLFGDKLVDKVKEIKAIGKVGEEMKLVPVKKVIHGNRSFKCEKLGGSEEVSGSSEREIIFSSKEDTDFQVSTETIILLEVESIPATESTLPEPLVSQCNVSTFAGRLKNFVKVWESISEDKFVLQTVRGYKIPFQSFPVQFHPPPSRVWSDLESVCIQSEIDRMLSIDKPELCIAKTLNQYLSVTKKPWGDNDSLFVSFCKPHKAVASETISRWIRSTLESLGVDKRFTAHSTRHASTSKACEKGVSIEEIKKVAGWSQNSKVFADFYQQPITIVTNKFAESVLSPSTSGS
ncbi:hypothetical protein NQ314_011935 [Rhamnusium bicolor]|uniref:Tyr recombinase domain-containing protein n=1 Tax=Rhamnusium bicolor TaxID=1586634 RepID=A0AAV8XFJ3_9CUCU|nr:hypothetical protein NQ314_011935 [Rhamnusium bicolor]